MVPRLALALAAALLASTACAAPTSSHEGPIVVSTTEAHRAELEGAAGRWVRASGLGLSVGDEGQGVPVHFAPQVFRDGAEVCGRAELSDGGHDVVALHVATDPRVSCTPGRALLHELGHLITITHGLDAHHPHMAEDSATLMAPVGTVSHIDVDTLIWVCSVAPCETFVNEQPPR